ncbi:DUF6221 family protein [Nonomuraea sp. NPDC001636]|uniref:DUF6221 family protein n=1 Tax=Actinomycetes TaxID=1760 RepID=UPI003318F732
MDDLIAFLRARLDEDEQTARAAGQLPTGDPWHNDPTAHWRAKTSPYHGVGGAVRWYVEDGHEDGVVGHVDPQAAQDDDIARHIARHDPARVLAEVDAKRALVADLRTDPHGDDEYSSRFRCGAAEDRYGNRLDPDDFARRTASCTCGRDKRVYRRIRLLAMPYAPHPDYRDEWRP